MESALYGFILVLLISLGGLAVNYSSKQYKWTLLPVVSIVGGMFLSISGFIPFVRPCK